MGETAVESPTCGTSQVLHPLQVEYCGNCSMPFEYCENYPDSRDAKIGCLKIYQNLERLMLGRREADGEDGKESAKNAVGKA